MPGLHADSSITVKNGIAIVCSLAIAIIGPETIWLEAEKLIPQYQKPSKRWAFVPPENESESFHKNYTIGHIDKFWEKFQIEHVNLNPALGISKISEKAEKFMERNLLYINENLSWELAMDHFDPKKSSLTVSTNDTAVRPIVATFFERAPKLPNWNFYAYFQPFASTQVEKELKSRYKSEITTYSAKCKLNDFNQIDVEIASPSFNSASKEENEQMALQLCQLVLGEENTFKWLGAIDCKKEETKSPCKVASDQFAKDFNAIKSQAIARLPSKPYFALDPKTRWNIFYSKDEKEQPAGAFLDIASMKTNSFYSERFSKNGEKFCILYSVKSESISDAEFQNLANKFNAPLVENKAGATLALAENDKTSHSLFFCLKDLPKAIELIKKVAKENNLSHESWIIFRDADMANEWVGIYKDSVCPLTNGEADEPND